MSTRQTFVRRPGNPQERKDIQAYSNKIESLFCHNLKSIVFISTLLKITTSTVKTVCVVSSHQKEFGQPSNRKDTIFSLLAVYLGKINEMGNFVHPIQQKVGTHKTSEFMHFNFEQVKSSRPHFSRANKQCRRRTTKITNDQIFVFQRLK